MRLLLPVLMMACSDPSPAPPPASPPSVEVAKPAGAVTERERMQAYWLTRTDAELDAAFEAACASHKADNKPVLLAFSAEWCIDCKRVYALSKTAPLAEELAEWHTVVINPGRFDKHLPVLGAFGVDRIVTWVATRPQDCRLPAPSWTRLRQGTFEPASGEPWTAEQLAVWLRDARGA